MAPTTSNVLMPSIIWLSPKVLLDSAELLIRLTSCGILLPVYSTSSLLRGCNIVNNQE
jgi:hypothetical protein